jgi:hypothetical protein
MSEMARVSAFGPSPLFIPLNLGEVDRPFRQCDPFNATPKYFPTASYAFVDQEEVKNVVDLYATGFAE